MKFRNLLIPLALCLLLAACAPAESPEAPGGMEPPAADLPGGEAPPSLAEDEEPAVLTCRIVDGAEDGDLLLAELGEGLYGGVYRLNLERGGLEETLTYNSIPGIPAGKAEPAAVPVRLDGEEADASVLEDGMVVDVAFNGSVLESFPAQFGEVCSLSAWTQGRGRTPAGTCFDLCGLYLQVLDDLWEKDKGLNEDIAIAGLDLSRAPGELAESEKAALAWRFGELHGVEVVTGTFEELREQGYFTAESLGEEAPEGAAFLHWEDGCFFKIEPNEDHEDEVYSTWSVLFFNAEKWRSSLGAYTFYDCSAMWPQGGTWTGYQIGSEMIS